MDIKRKDASNTEKPGGVQKEFNRNKIMEQEKKLLFGTTLKHLNSFDMALLKLAIMSFVLFLVSVWPAFANWVANTHWVWFWAAWIIFMILPVIKVWKK